MQRSSVENSRDGRGWFWILAVWRHIEGGKALAGPGRKNGVWSRRLRIDTTYVTMKFKLGRLRGKKKRTYLSTSCTSAIFEVSDSVCDTVSAVVRLLAIGGRWVLSAVIPGNIMVARERDGKDMERKRELWAPVGWGHVCDENSDSCGDEGDGMEVENTVDVREAPSPGKGDDEGGSPFGNIRDVSVNSAGCSGNTSVRSSSVLGSTVKDVLPRVGGSLCVSVDTATGRLEPVVDISPGLAIPVKGPGIRDGTPPLSNSFSM
jgi:hypothetical protein